MSLPNVRNFAIQLSSVNVATIAASSYDLIITDRDAQPDAAGMKARAGTPRLLIAYLSAGKAETSRTYWNSTWTTSPPSWLGVASGSDYQVKYWDAGWKNLMFGSPTAQIDRFIAAGFDGVLIDRLDVVPFHEPTRPTAFADMVAFINEMSAYAKAQRPDFIVIGHALSAAEPLFSDTGFLGAIDAISKETLWYSGNTPTSDSSRTTSLSHLLPAMGRGKPVLSIAYATTQDAIDVQFAMDSRNGFLTYIAPAALNALQNSAPTIDTQRISRKVNGTSQYFSLDTIAGGFRSANFNWFIGGFVKFNTATAGGTYVMDFGRPDPSGGLPNGRVRLIAQAGTSVKTFCSTVLGSGGSYRECAVTQTVAINTWYHIGVITTSTADVQLVWNGAQVGAKTGTVPTLQTDTICRVLQFGARVAPSADSFSPVSYSDWIWCNNFLPTTDQLTALGSGIKPTEIAGFSPTYYWPMEGTGTTEASLVNTATLTANGSPIPSGGPPMAVTASSTPSFIIVV